MNTHLPKIMSEPVLDKITVPFVPSFYHLALVKVALPLFYKYGSEEVSMAMTNIQIQNQPRFSERIQRERTLKYSRVVKEIIYIPGNLRRRVVEAVNAIECEVDRWRKEHFFLRLQEENTKCREEDVVYWKSDGTINRIKTAEELVRNENIRICVRFQIACKYCFTDSIKTLWSKIVASGQSEHYEMTDDSLESFWIQWIQTGSPADWTSVILRQSCPPVRCSSFFSSLQPEVRKEALTVVNWSDLDLDDLYICICAMSHEEQEKVLKTDVVKFLFLFLQWPLQDFFLEMAEKVKIYVNYHSFLFILSSIRLQKFQNDFDYCQLIVGFCNLYPEHYQNLLKCDPYLSDYLRLCAEENRFPKVLYIGPRKKLRQLYH